MKQAVKEAKKEAKQTAKAAKKEKPKDDDDEGEDDVPRESSSKDPFADLPQRYGICACKCVT